MNDGLSTDVASLMLAGATAGGLATRISASVVCPNAPRVLRVHQAGHAPAFGRGCETLVQPRRENGGLDDEPLYTLDVMLPGDFPHTVLRLRDPRGLTDRYEAWLRDGKITRVRA